MASNNPIVANAIAANWSKYFNVGDTVEAARSAVHKLGVKGTVTAIRPQRITVKWSDDGFEATYGIEGNFKNLTPKPVVPPEQKLREELGRSGAGAERDKAHRWLTAHRRGLVTKYGRDAYDKVWREKMAQNAAANLANRAAVIEKSVQQINALTAKLKSITPEVAKVARLYWDLIKKMQSKFAYDITRDGYERDPNYGRWEDAKHSYWEMIGNVQDTTDQLKKMIVGGREGFSSFV